MHTACISGPLCGKRALRMWQKRPNYVAKEPFFFFLYFWDTGTPRYCANVRDDCHIVREGCTRHASVPKETSEYGKRDLGRRQKRPNYVSKETSEWGKRDLTMWQKSHGIQAHRGMNSCVHYVCTHTTSVHYVHTLPVYTTCARVVYTRAKIDLKCT